MSEHLPRHRLEQQVADAQLQAHLAQCAQCTQRRMAIEQARAAFLAQRPAAGFVAGLRGREPASERVLSVRKIAAGAAFIAAAAALLLMFRTPAPPAEIRFKGGAAIEVYVKRGARAVPLHDGDALGAGDQLGFVYSLPRARHLLLLGIDDTGAISRYFPEQAMTEPLAPGARAQLPIGIELDAHRGEERLVALFSEQKIDEQVARRALTIAFEQARAHKLSLAALPKLELPAEQVGVWFRKP